jgi:hypothetical protein
VHLFCGCHHLAPTSAIGSSPTNFSGSYPSSATDLRPARPDDAVIPLKVGIHAAADVENPDAGVGQFLAEVLPTVPLSMSSMASSSSLLTRCSMVDLDMLLATQLHR